MRWWCTRTMAVCVLGGDASTRHHTREDQNSPAVQSWTFHEAQFRFISAAISSIALAFFTSGSAVRVESTGTQRV